MDEKIQEIISKNAYMQRMIKRIPEEMVSYYLEKIKDNIVELPGGIIHSKMGQNGEYMNFALPMAELEKKYGISGVSLNKYFEIAYGSTIKRYMQEARMQETLLLPLYGRKRAMEMYPGNFHDNDCQEIFERVLITYEKKGIMEKTGAIMAATRQYNMAAICRAYLKEHPKACVVNLGCGRDTTFRQVDNGQARAYNLAFDATNKKGLKNMHKTWLDGYDDVSVYFSVDDLNDISGWSGNFKNIVRNKYLSGYRPLDKRYGFILNTMFRNLDRSGMCQMIETDFA